MIVLSVAMKQESPGELKGHSEKNIEYLYTKIGLNNAVLRVTEQVCKKNITGIINVGGCGSRKYPQGTILVCRRFIQFDVDVTELGFKPGEIPFDEDPIELKFDPILLPDEKGDHLCVSGNRFVTEPLGFGESAVDMEAFGVAKVCRYFKIPFVAVKYVTDGADSNASDDFNNNLSSVGKVLNDFLSSRNLY